MERYTEFRNVRFFTHDGKKTGKVGLIVMNILLIYYVMVVPVLYMLVEYVENIPRAAIHAMMAAAVIAGSLILYFYGVAIVRARKASIAYMKEEDGTVWRVRFGTLLKRVGSRTVVDVGTARRSAQIPEEIATVIAEIKGGQRKLSRFMVGNKVIKISELEMVKEKKKYYLSRGSINGRKPTKFRIYKSYDFIEKIFEN